MINSINNEDPAYVYVESEDEQFIPKLSSGEVYFESTKRYEPETGVVVFPATNEVSSVDKTALVNRIVKLWFLQGIRHPVIETSEISEHFFDMSYVMRKDNKEIPKYTFQFEFCSDNRNIYVTKYYISQLQWIRTINRTDLRYYYIENANEFIFDSENLPSNASLFDTENPYVGDDSYFDEKGHFYHRYRIYNAPPGKAAYYITDSNNKVMLGIKGSSYFFFNLKSIRNDNIYDYNGIIVDKL